MALLVVILSDHRDGHGSHGAVILVSATIANNGLPERREPGSFLDGERWWPSSWGI